MMRKFLGPVIVLACLLIVAELLDLSAVRPFGAILSIAGMAFCLLSRMSARSKDDRQYDRAARLTFWLYAAALGIWLFLMFVK